MSGRSRNSCWGTARTTKVIALGEILTPDQLTEVQRIMNKRCAAETKASALKKYFKPFRKELLKKGVVAEYLAYVIAYKLSE